ncbi:SET domain-containing protein [Serendipita vermifera]|nr:SET domain-containing protein [Serendipita vermifera]
MNQDDSHQQKWQKLLMWLREHGMNTDENGLLVTPSHFEGYGRGLAALRDISPNELLFTIPQECLMNIDTLHKWSRQHSATKLSAVQQLTAYLALYHAKNGALLHHTPFWPYLDVLPANFEFHPLTWTTNNDPRRFPDVSELPKALQRQLLHFQQRFNKDMEKVHGIFPTLPNESCLWGWLNVNTRSLYFKCRRAKAPEDNITMCPLLDFANHSLEATNFNNLTHRNQGHPIPTMVAPSKGLLRGEQVFLLYGYHSNETLFVEYGFTDQTAGSELCLDEDVEALFLASPGGMSLLDRLRKRGYYKEWILHSEPTPARPSYRLVIALQLLHAAEGQSPFLIEWEEIASGRREEVSAENTAKVRDTLTSLCNDHLSEASRWLYKYQRMSSLDRDRSHGDFTSLTFLWERQKALVESVIETIKNSSGLDFQ